jgi:putative ABC transport system ATP-binding protein
MSLILLDKITKTYQMGETSHTVLHGVSLDIGEGELVALMGASGSGKSTLMNIIGLLDSPSHGRYLLAEQDVANHSDNQRAEIRNQTIGFVFQQFFLLPKLSALDNVALPLSYQGISHKEMQDRAKELLEEVNMADKLHHKPRELSGGQQQRVALARALVCQPKIILADEPTGALDSRTGDDVMTLFKRLHRQEKCTLLIITHDKNVANECERQINIKDGLIQNEADR